MSLAPTRRTRDAERSKEVILNAAERLFAELGYQGASLQDIGDAAGVSRGTPSYFFGSKEGLYRAVLERCFAGVGELVRRSREEAVVRRENAEEVLAAVIANYMDFLAERPHFVRLVQWESLSGGRRLSELSVRIETIHEVMEMASEEMRRGAFRPLDPSELVLQVAALCWFPFAQRNTLMRVIGSDPSDPEWLRSYKQSVITLVLDGIRLR